jgi:WhiB family transcriptional regulator, redox-sensing transcriptional regulator
MDLPPITELAERVRAGETVKALAAEYDLKLLALHGYFYRGGFTSTGEKRAPVQPKQWGPMDPNGLGRLVRSWSEPWMANAACAYVDPELWFPDRGGNVEAARAICAECPVAQPCREYALLNRERFGIWGNTSERERRKLLDKAYPSEGAA